MSRIIDKLGRFISTDPFWEKYLGWNAYQYSMNNPVSFYDGNGKRFYFHGIRANVNIAINEIEAEMSGACINVSRNGELSITNYSPKNDIEKEFMNAMLDNDVNVTLFLMNEAATLNESNGEMNYLLPGAYLGAGERNGNIEGEMALNLEFSKRHELVGGTTSGLNIIHEFLEGYFGAKDNGAHAPSDAARDASHNKVMSLDPRQNDGVHYIFGPGTGKNKGRIYRGVRGNKGHRLLFWQDNLEIIPNE